MIANQSSAADNKILDEAFLAAVEKGAYLDNPYLLGKEILGFDRFTAPHREWNRFAISNINPTCQIPGRMCVLQPRETYKTTFWTVTLAIWILVNNPNASILIMSAIEKNAVDMLRQIKGIFERCERFRQMFGDFVGAPWGTNEITVKPRTTLNSKEPSIMATGKGSIITSKHFDVIILDDIVSSVDRDSAAERQATLHCFQDVFDILKKDVGQLIIPGTRWHKQDLYAHIVQLNVTTPDSFKMLITPAKEKDGRLNFPTILSEAKLKDLREVKVGSDGVDISQYFAQYQLDPLSEQEQIFKTFHYHDINKFTFSNFISFVDPALSVKTTACFSAIITLGRIAAGEFKGRWFVVVANIKKRNATTLITDIIASHKLISGLYRNAQGVPLPHDMFIEDNGFQALLGDDVSRKALEGDYRLPIVGRTTTTKKETRIASIEPAVSQGFIIFRHDFNTAPDGYRLLIEQLTNFPQFEVDGPDALALCWEQSKSRYANG